MIRKEIRFRDKYESDYGYEYLKPYLEKYPNKPLHEILEIIFKEHNTYKNLLDDKMMFVDLFAEKIKTQLRILEVRTGYADKNSRILLELWNGFLLANNQANYVTTEKMTAIPLKKATRVVEENISNARQRILERKAKKIEKNESENENKSLPLNDGGEWLNE